MGETVTLAYEAAVGVRPVDARQAPTMVGHNRARNMHPRHHTTMRRLNKPLSWRLSTTPPPQQFGAQPQQPVGTDYDYQEEPYAEAGSRRWVALALFLVLHRVVGDRRHHRRCEVLVDDIPVISDTFDLGVKPDATCR